MGGLLKQYMWVANIVVILFCSYFAAKIVNVYVGKALEVRRSIGVLKKSERAEPIRTIHPKSYYDVILDRNIFNSAETPVETTGTDEVEKKRARYVPGQKAVKTSLNIKVMAVLVVGEGKDKRSSATISTGKEVDVYSVKGEKSFSPGVTLVQVKPDRIEFINKGRLEYASLEEEGIGSIFGPPTNRLAKKGTPDGTVKRETSDTDITVEDGKYVIDQREIDNALANLPRLYTEIRAVPNFQDGRVSGMRVLSVKPGSVFSKLGIKRGDILSRINGIELDVRRGFDIFSQLKDVKSFNLDLVRGGRTVTLEYEVR